MEDTSEADGAPLEEDSVESTEQDTLVTEEELSDSDTSNSEEDSADAPLSCLDLRSRRDLRRMVGRAMHCGMRTGDGMGMRF